MRFQRARAAWRCAAVRPNPVVRRAQRVGLCAVSAPRGAWFVAEVRSWSGDSMLFGKRKQVVKRILVVEDEPLTAFDNENMLGDAGYEIVATVDDLDEALRVLEREQVHLILSDVRLRGDRTGIELARAAKAKGVPTLFATGNEYPGAADIAVGCVRKPYTERQLCKAIEAVDRHLQGEKVKPPSGVELFLPPEGQQ